MSKALLIALKYINGTKLIIKLNWVSNIFKNKVVILNFYRVKIH